MAAEYTIKDLMAITQTTDRAIRQLFDDSKGNKELIKLKEEHIIKRQNRVYYDEVIYEWFIEHYSSRKKVLMENGVGGEEIDAENEEVPQASSPDSEEIERLKAELEQLRAKYEALEADFRKADGERVELLRQNGLKTEEISHLLLLLAQEKAEKQALLPPPRRTFGERISSLFHRKGVGQ